MSEKINNLDKNEYRRPAIKSVKAGEVIEAMGPAHAVYGSVTGGGSGDGGTIGQ